jgi:hypothetical protein
MSDSIVPVGSFAALAEPDSGFSLQDIVEMNMGGEGLDPSMLDKVKVPAGGATLWEVPGLGDEPDSVKDLIGVIVGIKNIRVFYEGEYDGGNEQPDCYSADGITGQLREGYEPDEPGVGGKCAVCPKAVWGTGKNGVGFACPKRMKIMLLQPDSMLPLVISVPPTSMDPIRQMLKKLTSARKLFFQVVTKLSLVKEKNQGGISYSKISPSYVRDLDETEAKHAYAMVRSLDRALSQSDEEPF